jgi:hypothetical protein
MFNYFINLVLISYSINYIIGGWGAVRRAGGSRVRLPMGRSLIFFNAPNPSSRIMAPGFNQPLTVTSI